AGISGGSVAHLAVGPCRILVQPGEALAERNLRHPRERGHVGVEADHCGGTQPTSACDRLGGRRPDVRLEAVGERPRTHSRTATAPAVTRSPSSPAPPSTPPRTPPPPSPPARAHCARPRNTARTR